MAKSLRAFGASLLQDIFSLQAVDGGESSLGTEETQRNESIHMQIPVITRTLTMVFQGGAGVRPSTVGNGVCNQCPRLCCEPGNKGRFH